MISHSEIVRRAKRPDHDLNLVSHPFSGRVSTWFSWAFINLGLSANQVTFLAFLGGLGSAILLLGDDIFYAAVAFILFRLHILFDVCDGEVARFRNQVSRFGAYWDQMLHTIVYPLIIAFAVVGRLYNDAATIVLVFGILGMMGRVADLGAKNAYYRVLYGQSNSVSSGAMNHQSRPNPSMSRRMLSFALHFVGYDAFLVLYTVAFLIPFTWIGLEARDFVIISYGVIFAAIALIRIALIPRNGGIPMRRDLI